MCLRPNHSPNAGWSNNDGAVNICLIRLQEWNIIYHVFFLRFGTADRLGKWSFMFFSHALQQVRKIIFRVFFSRFATAATYGKWSLIFFFFYFTLFYRCQVWKLIFHVFYSRFCYSRGHWANQEQGSTTLPSLPQFSCQTDFFPHISFIYLLPYIFTTGHWDVIPLTHWW